MNDLAKARIGFCVSVVVISAFNKYHLIVSGLFSNFKAPTIINKLLASHVYYGGSFKIRK